jgi:hypothetical protein
MGTRGLRYGGAEGEGRGESISGAVIGELEKRAIALLSRRKNGLYGEDDTTATLHMEVRKKCKLLVGHADMACLHVKRNRLVGVNFLVI